MLSIDSIKKLIFKKAWTSILIGLVFAGLFGSSILVFAIPPTTPYNPGETLNPDCNPSDPNCTIVTPTIYSFGGNNFSGTGNFTTTGTVTTGVLKISSVLTFPTTDGTSGQALTTNGSGALSWSTIDSLPSQAGNSGKFLTTNGSSASWSTIDLSGYVPYSGATADLNLGAHNFYSTGSISAGTTNRYGAITASGGTSFTTIPGYGVASIGTIYNTSSSWQGNGFLFTNSTAGTKAFSMVYNADKAWFGALADSSTDLFGTWNATGLTIGTSGANVNKLDVQGGVAIGFYAGSNLAPTNGLIVSGNVGIGLTNPNYALDINGDINIATGSHYKINGVNLSYSDIGAQRVMWYQPTVAGNNLLSYLPFSGNDSMTGTGNIMFGYNAGIANTTGSQNIFTGVQAGYGNTVGTGNIFTGVQSGYSNTEGNYNVFVGTGTGYANTTGSNNVFTGSFAGYRNTTGYQNIFSGMYAGYNNTTANDGIFLGYSAGMNNTTGSYNLFFGNSAGYSNTVGNHNFFVGFSSGYSNTSGANNIFQGYASGYKNTEGVGNVFTGSYAGYSNTTGGYNVLVGYAAGFNNTTGSNNIFSGTYAGYNNTGGNSNVFSGYYTGYSNTTGLNNIFLGPYAGYTNSSGYNSVFIGPSTGRLNTTGTENLFLGSSAGYNNTTGSYNVFLGPYAGYFETGSNKFFVDNQMRNNEAGSRTKSLMYGVFDADPANQQLTINGNVGIGTTNPTNHLVIGSTGGQSLGFQEGSNTKIITGTGLRSDTSYDSNLDALGGVRINLDVDNNSVNDFRIIDGTDNVRLLVKEDGNVGIGTTSPVAKLDIIGNAHIGAATEKLSLRSGDIGFNRNTVDGTIFNSSARAFQIHHDGSTNTASDFLAYQIYDGTGIGVTTSALVIKGDGNVGIGTTSPSYPLDVIGNARISQKLYMFNNYSISNNNTENNARIFVNDAGAKIERNVADSNPALIINQAFSGVVSTGDILQLQYNGSKKVVVDYTGNVGIGTTSPGVKLDVAGQGNFTSATYPVLSSTRTTDSTAGTYATNFFKLQSSGDMVDGFGPVSILQIRDNAGVDNPIASFGAVRNGADNSGDLVFSTYALGVTNEVARFTKGGNVGIGTTSPTNKLNVVGNIEIGDGNGNYSFYSYSPNRSNYGQLELYNINTGNITLKDTFSGGNILLLPTAGNVGIGITSPGEVLDVYSASARVRINSTTNGNNVGLRFQAKDTNGASGTSGLYFAKGTTDATTYLGLTPDDSTYGMVLNKSGNVGIGTTSPGAKLDVAGDFRVGYGGIYSMTIGDLRADAVGVGPTIGLYNRAGYTNFMGQFQAVFRGGTASSNIDFDIYAGGNSTTPKMTIQGTGNVGIGTTSPVRKLHVLDSTNGAELMVQGGSNDDALPATISLTEAAATSPTGFKFKYISSTNRFDIVSGDSTGSTFTERMSILRDTGNIGIGTTNPTALLTLRSSSTGLNSMMSFLSPADAERVRITYDSTNIRYGIAVSNSDLTTPQFNIINGGNVGIGTANPGQKLTVQSNATSTSLIPANATNGIAADSYKVLGTGTAATYGVIGTALAAGDISGDKAYGGWFAANSSVLTSVQVGLHAQTADAGNAVIAEFYQGTNARMVIKGDGNVGIGTTSPGGLLNVYNSANLTSGYITRFEGSYTDPAGQMQGHNFLVNLVPTSNNTQSVYSQYNQINVSGAFNKGAAHGFAGVVNNSGGGTLQAAVGSRMTIFNTGGGTITSSSGIQIDTPSNSSGTLTNTYGIYIQSQTNGTQTNTPYGIYQAGTADRNYFAGNVGIGTTAPTYALDVTRANQNVARFVSTGTNTGPDVMIVDQDNSTSRAALQIQGNAGAKEVMYVTSGGYIGIGTANPQGKFDITQLDDSSYTLPLFQYSTTATIEPVIALHKSAQNTIGNTVTVSGERLGEIQFRGNTGSGFGTASFIRGVQDGAYSTTIPGALTFWTSDGAVAAAERMRIDKSGNVGIGTTSPGALLELSGDMYLTKGTARAITIPDSASGVNGTDLTIQAGGTAYSFTTVAAGGNLILKAGNYNTASAPAGGHVKIYGGVNQWAQALYGNLYYYGENVQRFIVKSNGYVGLGAVDPTYQFQITNTTDGTPDVIVVDSPIQSMNAGAGIAFRNSYSAANMTIARLSAGNGLNYVDSYLKFSVADSSKTLQERMRINVSGNVGIGTTSPTTKLHIYDATAITNFTGSQLQGLTITGGTFAGNQYSLINFGASDYAGVSGLARIGAKFTGQGSLLQFGTSNSYSSSITNIAMTIDSSGNVGIGTTSPGYKLEVAGNTRVTGYLMIADSLNPTQGENPLIYRNNSGDLNLLPGSNHNLIISSGNVGIGTTSPDSTLKVVGDIRGTTIGTIGIGHGLLNAYGFANGTSSNNSSIEPTITGTQIRRDVADANPSLIVNQINASSTGDILDLQAAGVTKVAVTYSGNVGIGTTSPGVKLDVNGNLKVTSAAGEYALRIINTNPFAAIQIQDLGNDDSIRIIKSGTTAVGYSAIKIDTSGATGGNALTVNTNQLVLPMSGNVGIGTTSPQTKLSFGTSGNGSNHYNADTAATKFSIYDDGSNVQYGMGLSWNGSVYGLGMFANISPTGTPQVFLSTAGNVGIGTTSPGYLTEIVGGSAGVDTKLLTIRSNTITGGTSSTIRLVNSTSGAANYGSAEISAYRDGSSNGNLIFRVGGNGGDVMNEAVRILYNGNVGIGTTSPGSTLTVVGTTNLSGGTVTISNSTLSVSGGVITSSGSQSVALLGMDITKTMTHTGTGQQVNAINFVTTYNQPSATSIKNTDLLINRIETNLGTTPGAQYLVDAQVSGTSKFRVDNTGIGYFAGNVGIGTTSPGALLHVNGSAKMQNIIFASNSVLYTSDTGTIKIGDTSSGNTISISNSATSQLVVPYGNVGIGTTAPGAKLDVFSGDLKVTRSNDGNSAQVITTTYSSDGAEYRSVFGLVRARGSQSTPTAVVNNDWIGSLNFSGYDGSAWQYPGSVTGVVDGTPSSGNVPLRISFITGTNGGNRTERLTIKNDGNVGIGTTSPGQKLTVQSNTTSASLIPANATNGIAADSYKILGTGTDVTYGVIGTAKASGEISGDKAYGGWFAVNSSAITSAQVGLHAQTTDAGNSIIAEFYQGANARMVIKGDGNVGIGTTSPGAKLVVGDITGQNTLMVNGLGTVNMAPVLSLFRSASIEWVNAVASGSNYVIGANPANYTDASLLTSAKLVINAAGNVGIGTTNPGYPLTVSTASTNVVGLFTTSSNNNGSIQLQTTQGGSTQTFALSSFNGNASFGAGFAIENITAGTKPLFVNSSGNVGIGTTNPTQLLSVGSSSQFTVTSTGRIAIPSGVTFSWVYGSDSGSRSWQMRSDDITYGDWGLMSEATRNGSDWVRRLYINGSGNIGIGMTSPTNRLQVHASTAAWAQFENSDFVNASAGTALYVQGGAATGDTYVRLQSVKTGGNAVTDLIINNSGGNVGIGTTSPNDKLEVYGGQLRIDGGVNSVIKFYEGGVARGYIGNSSGAGAWFSDDIDNDLVIRGESAIALGIGATQRMRITSTGNVGIGITNPGTTLHVVAPAATSTPEYISKFSVSDDAGSYFAFKNDSATDSVLIPRMMGVNSSTYTGLTVHGLITTDTGANPAVLFKASDVNGSAVSTRPAFQFSNVNTVLMTILGGGNVGIGTTSPKQKLELYDTSAANLYLRKGSTTTNDYSELLFGVSTNEVYHGSIRGIRNGASSGSLTFLTQNVDGNYVSLAERMRIDNTGNVGIGTTQPTSLLNIVGEGASNGKGQLQISNPTGTANTGFSFDAGTASNAFSYMDSDTSVKFSALVFRDRTDPINSFAEIATGRTSSPALTGMSRNDFAIWNATSGKNLYFGTNDGTGAAIKMTILGNGNVGIGTTNPTAKMDINGSFYGAYNIGNAFSVGTNSPNAAYKINFENNINTDFTRLALFNGITTSTGGIASPMTFKLTSTGDMSNGHGPGFLYAIQDNAGVENFIARTAAYRNGADNSGNFQIDTYNAGVLGTVATFTNGGNVGIGTTSPTAKLELKDGYFYLAGTDVAHGMTDNYPTSVFGAMGIYSPTAGGLRIDGYSDTDATALVLVGGIGSEDPTDTTPAFVMQGRKKSGTGSQALGALETVWQLKNYSTALVTVLGNGNVGIGTTAPGYRLQVGETSNYGYVDATGAWQASSDIRYKSNIVPLGDSLNKILALEPIRYDAGSQKNIIGFSAQDVEKQFPELVSTDINGMKGLNYAGLTAPIIQSIKELTNQIKDLKLQINPSDGTVGDGVVSGVDLTNSFVIRIKDILAALGLKLDNGKASVNELCIGETCVNEAQLKELLNKNNVQPIVAPQTSTTPETQATPASVENSGEVSPTSDEVKPETPTPEVAPSTQAPSETTPAIDNSTPPSTEVPQTPPAQQPVVEPSTPVQ